MKRLLANIESRIRQVLLGARTSRRTAVLAFGILLICAVLIVIILPCTDQREAQMQTGSPNPSQSVSKRFAVGKNLYPTDELWGQEDRVYSHGILIDGADPHTFDRVSGRVYADKDSVFAYGSEGYKEVEGMSPENLRVLVDWDWAPLVVANETQVFFGFDAFSKMKPAEKIVASPAALQYLHGERDEYAVLLGDGTGFYIATNDYLSRLVVREPQKLGNSVFIKGRDKVFYGVNPMPEADPQTFELINQKTEVPSKAEEGPTVLYGKDSAHVYYKGAVVVEADPNTFEVYPVGYYQQYARDKGHVYFEGVRVIGADPKTFEVLSWQPYEGCGYGTYARDASFIYYGHFRVMGADPGTFKLHTAGYATDATHAYWNGIELDIKPADLVAYCAYG